MNRAHVRCPSLSSHAPGTRLHQHQEDRVHLVQPGIPLGPWADPHRAHAVDVAHRARLDHPGHGRPLHRRGPRRPDPVPVAVLGLPAGAGRVGPGLRQARRHGRTQARHPRRDRALPRRQHPLRVRLGHGLAHRHASPAGSRGRCGAAHDDDDRRRHLHRGRARQDPGLHRERVGRVVRRRPDARRRLLPVRVVALDLLRQHPVLPARRGHAVAQLRRVRRATPAPHRLRRGRRAHGRADAAHPRRPRGRPGLGVELVAEHRRLRRRRSPARHLRLHRAPRTPSRCCPWRS